MVSGRLHLNLGTMIRTDWEYRRLGHNLCLQGGYNLVVGVRQIQNNKTRNVISCWPWRRSLGFINLIFLFSKMLIVLISTLKHCQADNHMQVLYLIQCLEHSKCSIYFRYYYELPVLIFRRVKIDETSLYMFPIDAKQITTYMVA